MIKQGLQIDSLEYKNNYEKVLKEVCMSLLDMINEAVEKVQNEKGEKGQFKVSDICGELISILNNYRIAYEKAQQV